MITEKRFSKYVPDICNGYTVAISIIDNETGKQSESVDDFVDLLNELHEENQLLLKASEKDSELIKTLRKGIHQWRKENEQLKQFQDSVFSWIDMHLQRLPKLRDDEFESDNEFADPSLYTGAIYILETLKKELEK